MIRSIDRDAAVTRIARGVVVVLTFTCTLAPLGGCQLAKLDRAGSDSGGGSGGEAVAVTTAASRTLTAHLGLAVDEAVRWAADHGSLSPADVDDPAFVESVRRATLAQYDRALHVTPDQEQRFEQGRFAHAANARAIPQLTAQLRESGVPLTTVESYLTARFDADALSPPELELTRRLLRAHFDAALIREILSAF